MCYTYTYAEYLEDWEEHYYDDEEGDFRYWVYGKERHKTLKRMTEVEFDHALFQIGVIGAEINGLQELPERAKSSEYDLKIQQLFNKSFEFELALFM